MGSGNGLSLSRAAAAVEWPTLTLLFICYGAFLTVTMMVGFLGDWIATALLVPILVLHSSLQHEALHGHPFRNQSLNDFLVSLAPGLLVPYLRFKDTHLAHHYDPNLTDPYDDPESNYFDPANWSRLPGFLQSLLNFNNTLMGRMVLGPAIGLIFFYSGDLKAILQGNRRILWSYVLHLLGLFPVLLWLVYVSEMAIWFYLLATYLALSVLKIRTYLEHRAHECVASRTVIIEDRGPLALLFLNNNYHAVHHSHPKTPWYRLPALFRSKRDVFLKRNDGYTYRSYIDVMVRYFFRRKDPVAHPMMKHAHKSRSCEATSHLSLKEVVYKDQ